MEAEGAIVIVERHRLKLQQQGVNTRIHEKALVAPFEKNRPKIAEGREESECGLTWVKTLRLSNSCDNHRKSLTNLGLSKPPEKKCVPWMSIVPVVPEPMRRAQRTNSLHNGL